MNECHYSLTETTKKNNNNTRHNMTIELTREIGRRITMVTEDTKETT